MRKKKRLQPIKIWHILGQNDKILSQTKKSCEILTLRIAYKNSRLDITKEQKAKGKRQTAKREPTASPIPTWSPTVTFAMMWSPGDPVGDMLATEADCESWMYEETCEWNNDTSY